ncbi:MAG: hypothetical protein WCI74_09260 [Actinomycetes bacterium]
MDPSNWQNFAVVTGSASAALTGLVFVATSLNLQRIVAQGSLRIVAAQSMILLIMPLFIALAITIPADQIWIIGSLLELCALTIGILMYVTIFVVHRGRHDSVFSRRLSRATPSLTTCLFTAGAGVSLFLGFGGGLIWIVPAVVLAFAGGVTNAWLLLIHLDAGTPTTTTSA